MKKSQIWSMDTIIATIIFISAITAFAVIISTNYTGNSLENIKSEAKLVPEQLLTSENTQVSILTNNVVDLNKVKELQELNYDELKSLLGVKGNFCLYFETADGQVINLSDLTGYNGKSVGIGSGVVNLSNNVPCTQ